MKPLELAALGYCFAALVFGGALACERETWHRIGARISSRFAALLSRTRSWAASR